MALFKIFKGLKANLPTDKYVDGWCYITTDDGKMYIDTKDNDSTGRIVLNAEKADKLTVSAGSTSQPVYFKDGVPTKINYTIKKSVPSNAVFTDTHNISSNIVNKTESDTTDTTTALTNGNVYLNHIDGGSITSSHKISGSGATSVTTDTKGNIIISSTNSTYGAAGSGLGLVKSGGDVTITNGVINVNDNSHGHIIENIEGLQNALNSKSNTGHKHTLTDINGTNAPWETIDGQGDLEATLMDIDAHIYDLEQSKAPNNHASSSKTYGVGSGTNYGHVKLSSATNETATITDGIAATPAAVKAVNDKAITGLSVSGKVITYTKGDGSTGTITTQDTNTDTKVTQTEKSDNVNYPILGVPTASPTSGTAYTAVYDKGMHINPSTNTITATKFAGTADAALADGLGNNIVSTYETKTDAAAKLTEAKNDSATKLTKAKEYTDAAKTALLGGASDEHNTLDKLGDLITGNTQAIQVANSNINDKANSAITITAGNGLTGGGNLTTNRTIAVGAGTGITVAANSVSAKVRSTTKLTNDSVAAIETSGRVYPVAVDKSGYLAVNVPWANDNTTYSAGTGISINGTTINHFNNITAGSTVADAQTPAHGGSFNIPKIDYDAQGHITGVSTATVTLPADKNTDTKVTQNAKNDNVNYPLLGAYSSAPTSGTASTVVYDTGMHLNPSTNTITATNFAGTASKATADGLGDVITTKYETKTDAATKLEEAKTYADTAATTVKNDLLNGAGAAYDTLKELADEIIGNDQAIEVLTSTAANKAEKSITITAGNGLTGGGTLEANRTIAVGAGTGITVAANSVSAALVSTTKLTNAATAATETSGRVYPVAVDKNGKLAVNVPWSNTTYSAGTGISIDSSNKINHFNSVTAGTVGAAQTATHGGNIAIPSITYDAQGHITGATTVNVKLPADNNTDTKVTQGRTTTHYWRPILSHLAYGEYGVDPSPDGVATGQVCYHESMAIQPSTGTIKATTFDGNALKDGLGQNIVNTYATKTNAISSITGDGSSTTINYTKADGTTGSFTTKNTTYSAATSSKAGLMSAADKAKLDNLNDEKVKQTAITTNGSFPILLRGTSAGTSTITDGTSFRDTVTINPSTASITATTFNGDLNGNAKTATTATTATTADQVKQAASNTDNSNYPILLSSGTNTGVEVTGTPKRSSLLKYNPSTGLLTTTSLALAQTGTTLPAISMARTSHNYIQLPASGSLAICCSSDMKMANSSLIASASAVYPGVNASSTAGFTLGTESYKWKNVYAITFNGNLTGNVTGNLFGNADTATKVNNALTINGKTYDGSSAINVGTIGAAYGGTGKTTLTDSANALINALSAGTATAINDDVYLITQHTNTNETTYYRRKASVLYNYIQSKADGRYVNVSGDTMTGTLGLRGSVKKGTAPSSTKGEYIQFLETGTGTEAANRTGMVYNYINKSNDVVTGIYSYKSEAGVTTNAALYVQFMGDGTKKVNVSSGTKIYGAVWNDYAEFRKYRDSNEIPYGYVVIENGDDSLSMSTERLQKGGNICSDTYGFAIGESDNAKMPIAVSGRALVYTNENRNSYKPGDAVCTGPNGTVSKMTREEIKEYPDCIIGYVSAIPDYEIWGEDRDIKVNGRIWIKVV